MVCRRSSSGNIPKNHSVGPPRDDSKKLMTDLQCELEHFKGTINFMQIYNDSSRGEKEKTERCEYNSQTVAECPVRPAKLSP